jgi:hypothetical protein
MLTLQRYTGINIDIKRDRAPAPFQHFVSRGHKHTPAVGRVGEDNDLQKKTRS